MSLNLIFDTESSGLRRDTLDPLDDAQPRLVQLAAKLVEDDGRMRGRYVAIIKPDGWSIEPGAEAVHGISTRLAYRVGVPIVTALAAFRGLLGACSTLVGHNLQFDLGIIRSELQRQKARHEWLNLPAQFDTMERSTPYVRKPSEFGGFAYPSLQEAHRFFYPEIEFVSTHDAEEDLEATQRVWAALRKIEGGAHADRVSTLVA